MTFMSRILEDRRLIFAAWILIGLESLAAIWLFRPWAIGDSFHYLALAQSLAHGQYGSLTQAGFEADVLRPPAYPLILCFLLYMLHLPPIAAVAIQLIAYCGALYFIQRRLDRLGVNPVPFMVLAALYPFPLLYSAYLLTEAWVILVTTLGALVLVRWGTRDYALAGALAGIAALIRADLLLLPLVFFAVILIREYRSGWLRAIGRAALPVAVGGLVVLPYATWNYEKFGSFSPAPLAGAVGTSLYLSTWQRKFTDDDVSNLQKRRFTAHVRSLGLLIDVRRINREIGAPETIQTFDPYDYPTTALRVAAARAYVPAALDRIERDPGFYANHVFHNLWELWVTKKYPERIPPAVALLMKLSSWAIFLLGICGMAAAFIRPRGWVLSWTLVPITLYPAAIHLWLHTEARYTAATRLLLVMFAAAFLSWLLSRLRGPSERAQQVSSGALQFAGFHGPAGRSKIDRYGL